MAAKHGRRAGQGLEEDTLTPEDDFGTGAADGDQPPKPTVIQGNWGDDAGSKPKAGRRAGGGDETTTTMEIEDERLHMEAPKQEADDDSDDDIPVIPDLDEVREEDLTQQVAEAPSANVRVTTMADLDRDLESTLPFSQTESGIDLKLLTNVLCPASALKEDDNTWQFQQLFTEIKSELLSEKEEKEAKENQESASGEFLAAL